MPSQINNKNKFKAKIFKALSDPVRLSILDFLRDGEKCVCEIIPPLNLIQPLVSRHLKTLKDAGIVRYRKGGTKRMYSVVAPEIYAVIDGLTPELVATLAKEVFEHLACR